MQINYMLKKVRKSRDVEQIFPKYGEIICQIRAGIKE